MSRFLEALNKRVLVMDGAMGTQLLLRGVRPEDCFDAQNLYNPGIVAEVHRAYVCAGADIIETNTFGANPIKLADYGLEGKTAEINIAAVKIARQAGGSKTYVCGSIGPLGKMLEPSGAVSFDQAYAAFARQARALEEGGADVVSVETVSDLQEMRAAVIAVKSETGLPVIASLTYDKDERTIFGTPPEAAAAVLEPLGADVIAANCSTGPEGMLKVARRLLSVSRKPIMVMPNAGMPVLAGNRAVYKMTPKRFGEFAEKFAGMGVRIIGGCCGTTPEHIRAVKLQITSYKLQINPKSKIQNTKFASRTRVVEIKTGVPLLIGERINPAGRKLLQEEVRSGGTRIIRGEALSQAGAGADLIDVNVSVHAVPEAEAMGAAVKAVQSAVDIPLSIDSPSLLALESGLKQFCGRALVNSVNGKKESLERVLPLAVKYGAAIIALALDESGIPQTA